MSSPQYEARQRNKRRKEAAREVAAAQHGVDVNRFGDVKPLLGGASVEVVVWVTDKQIDDYLNPPPPARHKAYVAAPYELRIEAIRLMNYLEDKGIEVTSTWLRQLDVEDDEHARIDLNDVARADELIIINPEEFKRSGTGGRHVEVGYALALGKKVTIVGIKSNIFHHLSDVRVVERIEDL